MARRISRLERLARKEEKNVIRRIIYLSGISLILAILLIKLGIPLLGKFTDLLSFIFHKDETQLSTEKSVTQPPRIDSLPTATNSAKLVVSGSSEGATVEIYLNSEKAGQSKVDNGEFTYEDLLLKNGENDISAKALDQSGNESDFSQSKKVIFDKEPPKLEVSSPSDGQSFSQNNRIKVTGKTDKDAQVYANGFLATVDLDGNFEVFVPVPEGETTIEIKASDEAGNVTIQTRKITFKK